MSNDTPEILYEAQQQIGILQINRPAARNALNWQAQEQFEQMIGRAQSDNLRVLIITGTGDKAFVAGGDLAELAQNPDPLSGERLNLVMSRVLHRLTTSPFVVIGAVNGSVAGGGTEILSACDLRLAVPTAQFHFVQVKMGLTTGWGGTGRLVKLLGVSRAMELLLTGKSITAAEAHQIGFIHRLAPAGETALYSAIQWAKELSQLSQPALASLKELIYFSANNNLPESYAKERDLFVPLYGSPDNREAIQAFLEKRPVNPSS